QADLGEVKHEHYGEQAIGEHAAGAGGEQQPAVAADRRFTARGYNACKVAARHHRGEPLLEILQGEEAWSVEPPEGASTTVLRPPPPSSQIPRELVRAAL